jgi:hypothetical protein
LDTGTLLCMNLLQMARAWVYPEEILLSEQFNFGNREVLIVCNDLNRESLFLSSVQHGWYPENTTRPIPGIQSKFGRQYPYLAWSTRFRDLLKKEGYSKIFATGSPWSHLLRNLKIDPRAIKESGEEKNRLLFFPRHSAPGITIEHNIKLDHVAKVAGASDITVCLFWLDFIDPGIRNFYEKYGCRIVCVGYRGSSGFETPWAPIGGRTLFLPRILELMESHDLIAVDEVSTSFWYALSLRKKVIITSDLENFDWWGEGAKVKLRASNLEWLDLVSSNLKNIGIMQLIDPDEDLVEIALAELGWDCALDFKRLIELGQIKTKERIDKSLTDSLESHLLLLKSVR